MDVAEHLTRLGGVAGRATLVSLTSRTAVDRALADGTVVRDARGRYALPVADEALRAASALAGVVSHRSAALRWGWELKTVPRLPDVTVPRKRRVQTAHRDRVSLHYADLEPAEVRRLATSPRRTLTDCLRSLPFDEALAVADSALRHGSVDPSLLGEVAASVVGPGAPQARRVAAVASGLAANPFESVLRAIALDVPGLTVVPQVPIRTRGFSVQPDLVDEVRRVVLEADSFAWHGSRSALRDDARRYNNLVARGWTVLRFAWEDVMHDPAYVRRVLAAVAARADGQAG
ncbi:MAG: DUF559 domain-containing protein [Nocardioides sp.]